jgi:hypothetical protein
MSISRFQAGSPGAPGDDECSRLPTADVAALGLRRPECRKQPIDEVAFAVLIRGQHGGPDGRAFHHVRIDRDARGRQVACRLDAPCARVGGRAPRGIDDPDLAHGLARVGRHQAGQCLGRRLAGAQPCEPVRAVSDLGERLGGDRADTGLDPRDSGADEGPAALDRDAEPATGRIAGDDRVRHPIGLLVRTRMCRPGDSRVTWPGIGRLDGMDLRHRS